MDDIGKFLARLTPKERERVADILQKVQAHELDGFDVKKLKGTGGLFRVRAGSLRIIFSKEKDSIRALSIDRRSEGTYKRFRRST